MKGAVCLQVINDSIHSIVITIATTNNMHVWHMSAFDKVSKIHDTATCTTFQAGIISSVIMSDSV